LQKLNLKLRVCPPKINHNSVREFLQKLNLKLSNQILSELSELKALYSDISSTSTDHHTSTKQQKHSSGHCTLHQKIPMRYLCLKKTASMFSGSVYYLSKTNN